MVPRPGSRDADDDDDNANDVEDIGLDADDTAAAEGEQAQQHKPNPGSTTIGAGGYNVEIDNRAVPYVGLVLSAVILLVALVVPNAALPNEGYGIAVCVVNMIFGLFGAIMAAKNVGLFDRPLGTFPYFGSLTVGSATAQFLFLWTFIAAGVLTFDGPFLVTSNGYFACWGGVFFALMALGVTTSSIRERAGGLGYYNALMVASIIQICAVIPEMGGSGNGQSLYSLIVCILTIILVLAFGSYPSMDNYRFIAFAVFAILWIVLACYVTFQGPFLETGNGYFSAWLGCVFCVMAANANKPE